MSFYCKSILVEGIDLNVGIVKMEDLLIVIAVIRHSFGTPLTHADVMAGACTRNHIRTGIGSRFLGTAVAGAFCQIRERNCAGSGQYIGIVVTQLDFCRTSLPTDGIKLGKQAADPGIIDRGLTTAG